MHLYAPPLSKLRRLMRPIVSVADVATGVWELSPEDRVETRGAIHVAEELDRITGFSAHTDAEYEFTRLRPRTLRFAPTRLCELHDVFVSSGDLFKRSFKRMVRGDGRRRLLTRIDAEIDDAGIFCSTWLGHRYFGHWLAEDFADKMQAAALDVPSELEAPVTPHRSAYDALFDLPPPTVPSFALLRRVKLIESDLGSRFRVDAWTRLTGRIEELHPASRHVGCMLLRGTTGERRLLVNENEVADCLARLGFRVACPEAMPLSELLATLSGSRIVVGTEGSQLAHGFHCLKAPGAMVVLQPPDRFGCTDKDRCDRKGLLYGFTVGVPAAGGFMVGLDDLRRIIDRVSNDLDRSVTH